MFYFQEMLQWRNNLHVLKEDIHSIGITGRWRQIDMETDLLCCLCLSKMNIKKGYEYHLRIVWCLWFFPFFSCQSYFFSSSSSRETGSLVRLKNTIEEHIFFSPIELLKLSVPSLVYAVQNNMAFIALSNLDAAVYQVLPTFLFVCLFVFPHVEVKASILQKYNLRCLLYNSFVL